MVTLTPVAISIQSSRPTYAYGQMGTQLVNTSASMLIRAGMPSSIPPDAVVQSATLVVTQRDAVAGSVTANLRRLVSGFSVSRTTWNNVPAMTGSTVSVVKAAPAAGTQWSFDVTADVQAYVSGSLPNYGWRLATTTAAALRFRGALATSLKPTLIVDYVEPGEAPADLYPDGGTVSIAKPTLSFLVAPDTVAVNVQVDANATAPYDFDSGTVASTVGELDLNATAYAGLAAGATVFWRARSQGATGFTPFSAWASFSRVAKPTVSITSPAASSDDVSPPILWSVSGGTQSSWQVIVRSTTGALIADSGRVSSAATTWTAPKNIVTREGASVVIEVRVWDNVVRAVTPGDPAYSSATLTYTLSASAGVTAPSAMDATNDGKRPSVVVTGTAVSAPDGWAVIRDGVRVYYNAAQPTLTLTWTDWTATPNHAHTYRVARVVNGQVSSGGPTKTITPRCTGLWLLDPSTGAAAVLWGMEDGSWSAGELAVLHQPIAGPPIRRVAYRPPLSGSASGDLVDADGIQTADVSIANLYDFKSSDADRELRFVAGDRSIPVNVGDITVSPTSSSGVDRWSRAAFSWWQVDDVPWEA